MCSFSNPKLIYRKTMSEFYNSIIDTDYEVGKIFESFGNDQTVQNWRELQTEFHQSIEEDFPAIRCNIGNNIAKEQNLIPKRLAKRIKVTTLILGTLALGGKYSRKMYLNAVEFCTMPEVNKWEFVQDFSKQSWFGITATFGDF